MTEANQNHDSVQEPAAIYNAARPAADGIGAFFMAQEELQHRLLKVTSTLDVAGIRYAVIGGLAVAEHVGRVDPGAIRTTSDVDLLMEEEGLEAAKPVLAAAGFKYRHAAGIHMFMDTPSARTAVHVIIAGRRVRPEYVESAPKLEGLERAREGFAVLPLRSLVTMKLTSFRRKDQTHLDDMVDVGLLPGDVMDQLRPELRERLQYLLDNPE